MTKEPKEEDNFLECFLHDYGLKINYPNEWIKVDKNPVIPNDVIVSFGRGEESFNIYLLDIPSNSLSLKELIDQNILDLKKENPSFNLIELSPTTIAGLPAYHILYTITRYKTLNICTIKGNKVYMLVYGSKLDTYEKYLSTVEQMIASFEFL